MSPINTPQSADKVAAAPRDAREGAALTMRTGRLAPLLALLAAAAGTCGAAQSNAPAVATSAAATTNPNANPYLKSGEAEALAKLGYDSKGIVECHPEKLTDLIGYNNNPEDYLCAVSCADKIKNPSQLRTTAGNRATGALGAMNEAAQETTETFTMPDGSTLDLSLLGGDLTLVSSLGTALSTDGLTACEVKAIPLSAQGE